MYRNVVVDQTDVIRILHVDDDMSQGEFLKYFLPVSDGTFSISAVSDPSQALKELRTGSYDCVVTDYQMPELNGIELAAMIRKEFDIPIIIYTGQGSEEVAEAAFSVGIDDYLRKEMDPSHYQVLAKRIRSVVEKKRIDTLYKTVIEQIRDALIILVDKKLVYANKAFLDLIGVHDVKEIQDPFYFAVDEDKKRIFRRYKEVIDNDKSREYNQYKVKKKNGEIVEVEVSTSKITYNGKTGILSLVRDITEKNKLEAEKKETQERFESLIKLAPDGIVTVNMTGTVTSVNPAFRKLTGFKDEEIIGVNLLKLPTIQKNDFLRNFKLLRYAMKGSLPPPFTFIYKKKDGTKGWAEAHACFIDFKGKKEILAIIREVTERIQLELMNKNKVDDFDWLYKELDQNQVKSDGKIITDLLFLINEELMIPLHDLNEFMINIKNDPVRIKELTPIYEEQIKKSIEFLKEITSRIVETYNIPEVETIEQENIISQDMPA